MVEDDKIKYTSFQYIVLSDIIAFLLTIKPVKDIV
jgi:hypothetical protein